MTVWIFPSNPNTYDVKGALVQQDGLTDWKKGNRQVKKGDIVYLYASSPVKRIIAKLVVENDDVSEQNRLKDEKFWKDSNLINNSGTESYIRLRLLHYLSGNQFSYYELKKNGLSSTVQSKIKVPEELNNYLEEAVSKMIRSFYWVEFHEELAAAFLEYKNRKEEFLDLVQKTFDNLNLTNPFRKEWISSSNLDPFSVFSAINRNLTWDNKKQLLENLKTHFNLNTPVYSENYQGIPFSNNQKFMFMSNKGHGSTERLWELFELAITKGIDNLGEHFVNLYNESITVPYIKWNMTMALFWIQPRKFLTLDANVRSLIKQKYDQINPEKDYDVLLNTVISGENYLELITDINTFLTDSVSEAFDFPSFSAIAYTSEKSTINYQAFYDFKQYHGQKYQDPAKSDSNTSDMIEFKKKGQSAREEFQKVVHLLIPHITDKLPDKVPSWINQGQIGHAYFWTFLRDNKEYKNSPAIALALSDAEKSDELNWVMEVNVLNFHAKEEEDILRQNQVLDIPLTDGLYYVAETQNGQHYVPDNQEPGFLKQAIKNREIRKVQLKIDIGKVEDFSHAHVLIDALLDAYQKLEPYYLATKEVSEDKSTDTNSQFYVLRGDKDTVFKSLETGEWKDGFDVLKEAEVGDQVGLAILKKHNYPYYDIPLQRSTKTSISCYYFYARGEIEEVNLEEGFVSIIWEEFDAARPWYLYTYAHPVWKISMERPAWRKNLYNFIFNDEPQQFDLFLNGHNFQEVNLKKRVSYTKDDFLKDVFIDDSTYERIINLLKRKRNIVLQGPPGVGKTFIAKRLAYSFIEKKSSEHVKMIQFHQSYSYEDFIEGIKPTIDSDGFLLKDGVFKEFVERAQLNPQEDYFFIIDEINRGNISKVFGELLMLIESDKRGEDYQIPLQYSDDYFYVPENLYIIGMMNTADRGLAMMDYALRRRFAFYDVLPALENTKFINQIRALGSPKAERLRKEILKLNDSIREDPSLGKGFEVGHSYLTLDIESFEETQLLEIIEYEIIPLLNEYWFDNPDKVDDWKMSFMEALDE